METVEILQILASGEDSRHQFKRNVTNADALAAEMIAFSNTLGGKIFIGVDDDGTITGLTPEDIARLNQLVSNTASQNVKPAINPLTQNTNIGDNTILIIDVPKGINKPYLDKDGVIWVKSAADKRKATSREEMQRLFQSSGSVHADENPIENSTINDFDSDKFAEFFKKEFGETPEEQDITLLKLLENMNLAKDGTLNLAGLLLFGKNNEFKLPVFRIKCVCYPTPDIHEEEYLESMDCVGDILRVFKEAIAFLDRNIRSVQGGQGVNSTGIKEIPKIVFEELVTNALIHRDYFISAGIRIFVFIDRIEIISPGHLPNNLTVDNIKTGNSNSRNPVLTSFASKILPYRGLGNGIRRAIKVYPDIKFINDREGNQFKCIINRKQQ